MKKISIIKLNIAIVSTLVVVLAFPLIVLGVATDTILVETTTNSPAVVDQINPNIIDESVAVTTTTESDAVVTSSPSQVTSNNQAITASENPVLEGLKNFGENLNLSGADPRTIVVRLINLALGFVGIIFLITVLASGFAYMTSGGNAEKTKAAGKIFINALVGLFIMLAAYAIVTFVINTLSTATGV